MATHRTYTCDLCKCSVEKDSGKGIQWTGCGASEGINFTRLNEAERHLCTNCLRQIRDAIEAAA